MLWRDTPWGGPNAALDEFGHKHKRKALPGKCERCSAFASTAGARYCKPCGESVKLVLKREYMRKFRLNAKGGTV